MSDWRDDARCLGADPETWFPAAFDRAHRTEIAAAKAVCEGCPSKTPCLEFGLAQSGAHDHDHGIWGGTTPRERRVLRKEAEHATVLAEAS